MGSGAHFTTDFSIVIQIQRKCHCALIQVVVKWSLWNFVHGKILVYIAVGGFQSLWNLAGISAGLLPMCLSNVKVIWISRCPSPVQSHSNTPSILPNTHYRCPQNCPLGQDNWSLSWVWYIYYTVMFYTILLVLINVIMRDDYIKENAAVKCNLKWLQMNKLMWNFALLKLDKSILNPPYLTLGWLVLKEASWIMGTLVQKLLTPEMMQDLTGYC